MVAGRSPPSILERSKEVLVVLCCEDSDLRSISELPADMAMVGLALPTFARWVMLLVFCARRKGLAEATLESRMNFCDELRMPAYGWRQWADGGSAR